MSERPSIADPTEGPMVDEEVDGLIVCKLGRKHAVVIGYCDFIVHPNSYINARKRSAFRPTLLPRIVNKSVFKNRVIHNAAIF